MKVRAKAILFSIKYGLLPYWCYEKKCHYYCSYLEHLVINIKYAWRWITFNEYQGDIEFEQKTNNNFLNQPK